jgi:hypothetical protein
MLEQMREMQWFEPDCPWLEIVVAPHGRGMAALRCRAVAIDRAERVIVFKGVHCRVEMPLPQEAMAIEEVLEPREHYRKEYVFIWSEEEAWYVGELYARPIGGDVPAQ